MAHIHHFKVLPTEEEYIVLERCCCGFKKYSISVYISRHDLQPEDKELIKRVKELNEHIHNKQLTLV